MKILTALTALNTSVCRFATTCGTGFDGGAKIISSFLFGFKF
jgi:hypothetical protein